MITETPYNYPERHLFFGGSGFGKSRAFVEVYDDIVLPGGHRLFVVDTDHAVGRMFQHRDKSALLFEEPTNFRATGAAFNKFASMAKPDDWIIIDLVSPVWQWAQDFDLIQNHKVQENELMFWAEPPGFDRNWSRVNQYYSNMIKLVQSAGCHIIAIAEETELIVKGSWMDDRDVRDTFGAVGKKPVGNKRNMYLFHDVTHFSKLGDRYEISMVKEREGRKTGWLNEEWTDRNWVTDYLIPAWEGDFNLEQSSSSRTVPSTGSAKSSARKKVAKKRAAKRFTPKS